jgi:glucokinase
VDGIGLATPGPLNLREGRIIHAANLPGWIDVAIRDSLAQKSGLPVVLENDANAAAYGEFIAGAGRGCQHMTLFTLGTGIGSGVIIDGRIFHGHFDNAGELGHMIVVVGGEPCPCGQRGCLERYSSADAVARRAANQSVERERHDSKGQGRRDEGTKGRREQSVERERHDSSLSAEEVASRAKQGDPACAQVWNEACLYLAVACVNVQHAYNSQRIILGGGMSQAGDFLLSAVRRHLAEQSWKLHNDLPEIRLAELGADAGLVGAAALVRDHRSKTENPACSK